MPVGPLAVRNTPHLVFPSDLALHALDRSSSLSEIRHLLLYPSSSKYLLLTVSTKSPGSTDICRAPACLDVNGRGTGIPRRVHVHVRQCKIQLYTIVKRVRLQEEHTWRLCD